MLIGKKIAGATVAGQAVLGRTVGAPVEDGGASLSLGASYTHPADGTDTSGGYAAGSVSASNGAEPYTYSKVSGAAELTVNATTGAVTRVDGGDGLADYGENLSATFRVTDDNAETADRIFTSAPVSPSVPALVRSYADATPITFADGDYSEFAA